MTIIGGGLIALGVSLTLLAAIGTVRLPDVLIRMNAATKAASLGVACVLVGVVFLNPSWSAAIKMTAAVLLQFATAPIVGHVIGRAAHRTGAPLWDGTRYDDLAASGRSPRSGPTFDGTTDFERDPS